MAREARKQKQSLKTIAKYKRKAKLHQDCSQQNNIKVDGIVDQESFGEK